MKKEAAFLETRRYAALPGATTEFNKFEGVTHNTADRKTYVVMSRVEGGISQQNGNTTAVACVTEYPVTFQ
jgi:hypothetical protein